MESRILTKCLLCKNEFELHKTFIVTHFKDHYLCQQCLTKDKLISRAYMLWRYIINNYHNKLECIYSKWIDPDNGFWNFFEWFKTQEYNDKYFLVEDPYDLNPQTCKFTKYPNDFTKLRLFKTFSGIIRRTIKKHTLEKRHQKAYKNITIYKEWLGPNGFKNFYNWAINNGYRCYLTIDRIDSNREYSPNNCRWIYYYEQNINRNRYSTNKTGYTGVRYYKQRKSFYAYVHYDYKIYPIGYFENAYDASVAYDYFIYYNKLNKPYNNKWRSLKELEKEFERIKIKTYKFSSEKNRKKNIHTGYISIMKNSRNKNKSEYMGCININNKDYFFDMCSNTCLIPLKLAIVRDYLILKYNLPLKQLINIDFNRTEKKIKGYILNFPDVLFDKKKKKQLFRLGEKIIKKYNINIEHIDNVMQNHN